MRSCLPASSYQVVSAVLNILRCFLLFIIFFSVAALEICTAPQFAHVCQITCVACCAHGLSASLQNTPITRHPYLLHLCTFFLVGLLAVLDSLAVLSSSLQDKKEQQKQQQLQRHNNSQAITSMQHLLALPHAGHCCPCPASNCCRCLLSHFAFGFDGVQCCCLLLLEGLLLSLFLHLLLPAAVFVHSGILVCTRTLAGGFLPRLARHLHRETREAAGMG